MERQYEIAHVQAKGADWHVAIMIPDTDYGCERQILVGNEEEAKSFCHNVLPVALADYFPELEGDTFTHPERDLYVTIPPPAEPPIEESIEEPSTDPPIEEGVVEDETGAKE